MKNQAKLKYMELNGKEKYYYIRFGEGAENVPDGYLGVVTVCIIPYDNGFVRGIAFCNPKDQFVKKLGRNIALGRALQALESGDSSNATPKKTPASVLRNTRGHDQMFFFSEFNCELTEYEKKIVK